MVLPAHAALTTMSFSKKAFESAIKPVFKLSYLGKVFALSIGYKTIIYREHLARAYGPLIKLFPDHCFTPGKRRWKTVTLRVKK